MKSKRILVADGHTAVRKLLVERLCREVDFSVVGEAGNSTQTMICALLKKPDLLLIDPLMPDGLGLRTLRQIKERLPNVAVVVLTSVADIALQEELHQIGVCNVQHKSLDLENLMQQIRRTLELA